MRDQVTTILLSSVGGGGSGSPLPYYTYLLRSLVPDLITGRTTKLDYKNLPDPVEHVEAAGDDDRVYASVIIELDRCGSCLAPMYNYTNDMWPKYWGLRADEQARKVGWKRVSILRLHNEDHELICEPCVEAGEAKFKCVLCERTLTSKHIQKKVGDPSWNADYLCKECYATVPAQKWDGAVIKLLGQHRWDND